MGSTGAWKPGEHNLDLGEYPGEAGHRYQGYALSASRGVAARSPSSDHQTLQSGVR